LSELLYICILSQNSQYFWVKIFPSHNYIDPWPRCKKYLIVKGLGAMIPGQGDEFVKSSPKMSPSPIFAKMLLHGNVEQTVCQTNDTYISCRSNKLSKI
jgi:hypothetical protein